MWQGLVQVATTLALLTMLPCVAAPDYDLRCENVFEHTPSREQNSLDELSVLVSSHPDSRVYHRQFKARHTASNLEMSCGSPCSSRR